MDTTNDQNRKDNARASVVGNREESDVETDEQTNARLVREARAAMYGLKKFTKETSPNSRPKLISNPRKQPTPARKERRTRDGTTQEPTSTRGMAEVRNLEEAVTVHVHKEGEKYESRHRWKNPDDSQAYKIRHVRQSGVQMNAWRRLRREKVQCLPSTGENYTLAQARDEPKI